MKFNCSFFHFKVQSPRPGGRKAAGAPAVGLPVRAKNKKKEKNKKISFF
jgi:hypothetical protein